MPHGDYCSIICKIHKFTIILILLLIFIACSLATFNPQHYFDHYRHERYYKENRQHENVSSHTKLADDTYTPFDDIVHVPSAQPLLSTFFGAVSLTPMILLLPPVTSPIYSLSFETDIDSLYDVHFTHVNMPGIDSLMYGGYPGGYLETPTTMILDTAIPLPNRVDTPEPDFVILLLPSIQIDLYDLAYDNVYADRSIEIRDITTLLRIKTSKDDIGVVYTLHFSPFASFRLSVTPLHLVSSSGLFNLAILIQLSIFGKIEISITDNNNNNNTKLPLFLPHSLFSCTHYSTDFLANSALFTATSTVVSLLRTIPLEPAPSYSDSLLCTFPLVISPFQLTDAPRLEFRIGHGQTYTEYVLLTRDDVPLVLSDYHVNNNNNNNNNDYDNLSDGSNSHDDTNIGRLQPHTLYTNHNNSKHNESDDSNTIHIPASYHYLEHDGSLSSTWNTHILSPPFVDIAFHIDPSTPNGLLFSLQNPSYLNFVKDSYHHVHVSCFERKLTPVLSKYRLSHRDDDDGFIIPSDSIKDTIQLIYMSTVQSTTLFHVERCHIDVHFTSNEQALLWPNSTLDSNSGEYILRVNATAQRLSHNYLSEYPTQVLQHPSVRTPVSPMNTIQLYPSITLYEKKDDPDQGGEGGGQDDENGQGGQDGDEDGEGGEDDDPGGHTEEPVPQIYAQFVIGLPFYNPTQAYPFSLFHSLRLLISLSSSLHMTSQEYDDLSLDTVSCSQQFYSGAPWDPSSSTPHPAYITQDTEPLHVSPDPLHVSPDKWSPGSVNPNIGTFWDPRLDLIFPFHTLAEIPMGHSSDIVCHIPITDSIAARLQSIQLLSEPYGTFQPHSIFVWSFYHASTQLSSVSRSKPIVLPFINEISPKPPTPSPTSSMYIYDLTFSCHRDAFMTSLPPPRYTLGVLLSSIAQSLFSESNMTPENVYTESNTVYFLSLIQEAVPDHTTVGSFHTVYNLPSSIPYYHLTIRFKSPIKLDRYNNNNDNNNTTPADNSTIRQQFVPFDQAVIFFMGIDEAQLSDIIPFYPRALFLSLIDTINTTEQQQQQLNILPYNVCSSDPFDLRCASFSLYNGACRYHADCRYSLLPMACSREQHICIPASQFTLETGILKSMGIIPSHGVNIEVLYPNLPVYPFTLSCLDTYTGLHINCSTLLLTQHVQHKSDPTMCTAYIDNIRYIPHCYNSYYGVYTQIDSCFSLRYRSISPISYDDILVLFRKQQTDTCCNLMGVCLVYISNKYIYSMSNNNDIITPIDDIQRMLRTDILYISFKSINIYNTYSINISGYSSRLERTITFTAIESYKPRLNYNYIQISLSLLPDNIGILTDVYITLTSTHGAELTSLNTIKRVESSCYGICDQGSICNEAIGQCAPRCESWCTSDKQMFCSQNSYCMCMLSSMRIDIDNKSCVSERCPCMNIQSVGCQSWKSYIVSDPRFPEGKATTYLPECQCKPDYTGMMCQRSDGGTMCSESRCYAGTYSCLDDQPCKCHQGWTSNPSSPIACSVCLKSVAVSPSTKPRCNIDNTHPVSFTLERCTNDNCLCRKGWTGMGCNAKALYARIEINVPLNRPHDDLQSVVLSELMAHVNEKVREVSNVTASLYSQWSRPHLTDPLLLTVALTYVIDSTNIPDSYTSNITFNTIDNHNNTLTNDISVLSTMTTTTTTSSRLSSLLSSYVPLDYTSNILSYMLPSSSYSDAIISYFTPTQIFKQPTRDLFHAINDFSEGISKSKEFIQNVGTPVYSLAHQIGCQQQICRCDECVFWWDELWDIEWSASADAHIPPPVTVNTKKIIVPLSIVFGILLALILFVTILFILRRCRCCCFTANHGGKVNKSVTTSPITPPNQVIEKDKLQEPAFDEIQPLIPASFPKKRELYSVAIGAQGWFRYTLIKSDRKFYYNNKTKKIYLYILEGFFDDGDDDEVLMPDVKDAENTGDAEDDLSRIDVTGKSEQYIPINNFRVAPGPSRFPPTIELP